MSIKFELSEYVDDLLYEEFNMTAVAVQAIAKDEEDKNSLYALVYCKDSGKHTIVYQDDEGGQSVSMLPVFDGTMVNEIYEGLVQLELVSAFIGPYSAGLDLDNKGYTLNVGERVIYRLYEWCDEWAEDTVYGIGIITDTYSKDSTICHNGCGLFLDKTDDSSLSEEEIVGLFIKDYEEGESV